MAKHVPDRPRTVITAPATTFDQIMPAVGVTLGKTWL
jgi:hypothetical protein